MITLLGQSCRVDTTGCGTGLNRRIDHPGRSLPARYGSGFPPVDCPLPVCFTVWRLMAFPDKSVYVWYLLFITTCILWVGINFVFYANREPQKRPFDPPKVQEKACNEADNGAFFSDDSRQWNCESIPSSPIVINLAGLRLGSGSAATKTNTHVAKWAF